VEDPGLGIVRLAFHRHRATAEQVAAEHAATMRLAVRP
jgi:hypothetical protein